MLSAIWWNNYGHLSLRTECNGCPFPTLTTHRAAHPAPRSQPTTTGSPLGAACPAFLPALCSTPPEGRRDTAAQPCYVQTKENREEKGRGGGGRVRAHTHIRTKSDCFAARPGEEYFSTNARVLKPNLWMGSLESKGGKSVSTSPSSSAIWRQ